MGYDDGKRSRNSCQGRLSHHEAVPSMRPCLRALCTLLRLWLEPTIGNPSQYHLPWLPVCIGVEIRNQIFLLLVSQVSRDILLTDRHFVIVQLPRIYEAASLPARAVVWLPGHERHSSTLPAVSVSAVDSRALVRLLDDCGV